MKRWIRVVAVLFLFALPLAAALAAGPIVLDGLFGDWSGQACIADPTGDQTYGADSDLTNFCFATNPNDNTAYFMAERSDGSLPISYLLVLDTNQDGVLTDVDRIVWIDYYPLPGSSDVSAVVYDGFGNPLWLVLYGDTGASAQEGGLQVEWGLPFYTLGIQAGQTVDMFLATVPWYQNNISDVSALVTWSPADALGLGLLAVLVLGGVLWFAWLRRRVTA